MWIRYMTIYLFIFVFVSNQTAPYSNTRFQSSDTCITWNVRLKQGLLDLMDVSRAPPRESECVFEGLQFLRLFAAPHLVFGSTLRKCRDRLLASRFCRRPRWVEWGCGALTHVLQLTRGGGTAWWFQTTEWWTLCLHESYQEVAGRDQISRRCWEMSPLTVSKGVSQFVISSGGGVVVLDSGQTLSMSRTSLWGSRKSHFCVLQPMLSSMTLIPAPPKNI